MGMVTGNCAGVTAGTLVTKIIKRTAKALHGHLQGTLNASFDGRVFIGRYAITKRANTLADLLSVLCGARRGARGGRRREMYL